MAREEATEISEELEQLRRRFESAAYARAFAGEFVGSGCGVGQAQGVNPTARALRLGYAGLRRRVKDQDQPKRKPAAAVAPSFLEFVAPGAKAVTNCMVEVESAQGGKLRLELKAIATTELANLIRAFVSH